MQDIQDPFGADRLSRFRDALPDLFTDLAGGVPEFTCFQRPLQMHMVMAEDGILPAIVQESARVWTNMTGLQAPLFLEQADSALLGVKIVGMGSIPVSLMLPVTYHVLQELVHERVFRLDDLIRLQGRLVELAIGKRTASGPQSAL